MTSEKSLSLAFNTFCFCSFCHGAKESSWERGARRTGKEGNHGVGSIGREIPIETYLEMQCQVGLSPALFVLELWIAFEV